MIGTYLTDPIFGDNELKERFSDASMTRAMLEVEAALAMAQAGLGVVPEEEAKDIAETAAQLDIDPRALAEGVRSSGVPVPALVAALKKAVGQPASDYVHFGLTSQDVVDTATVLCLRGALDDLAARLASLIDALAEQSDAHDETVMLARTRGQLATPTTAGLRIAQWAQPLIEFENELVSVEASALRVQVGGASGNRTALGAQSAAVSAAMAHALGLADAPPWHTNRAGFHRLAGWLNRVVSACGKIGADIALSSRGEVAEMRAGGGGGSSTMPHKSNPVTAEALEALNLAAQAYYTGFTASAAQREERDGAAWSVEWLFLPQLVMATGAALKNANRLAESLQVNADVAARRISDTPAVMTEAAVFALAQEIGRSRAVEEVKLAMAEGGALGEALRARGFTGIDWEAVLDPAPAVSASRDVARQIFDLRAKKKGP